MASASTSRRAWVALGSLLAGYVLIDLVAGAPDSPLVPPLPPGIGLPQWTTAGARWIGLGRLSRTGLTMLATTLLAAIVTAFLLVLLEARRGRVRLGLVLAAAGLSLGLSVAAPVVLSRDVYSYAAYGRIYALYHANPYVRTPSSFPTDPFVEGGSPLWINTRAVYGPFFVLIGAGVARVWSGSPAATVLAFKVLAGMGAALATAVGARAARTIWWMDGGASEESTRGRAAFAAAAVGLNPVVVVHSVGGAHNDALILACLAGALILSVRRVRGAVGFSVTGLLTIAGLIKVILFPALLVWLWLLLRATPPERRKGLVILHVGGVLALSLAFSAPFLDGGRALGSLVTLASVEGWASPAHLVARGARALGHVVGGTGAADYLGKVVIMSFLVLFAVVFIGYLRRQDTDRSLTSTPAHLADVLGSCLLGLALAIPYLLPWYAAWFLPFLAVMSDGRLAAVGFAVAGLLALTGIPAEPGSAPILWRDMVFGVHYGIAPIMLALFLIWAGRVLGIGSHAPPDADVIPRMADRARP